MNTPIKNRYDFVLIFDVQMVTLMATLMQEIFPVLIRKPEKAW
jgi:hypothetical protein